jgi:hypothetical protein
VFAAAQCPLIARPRGLYQLHRGSCRLPPGRPINLPRPLTITAAMKAQANMEYDAAVEEMETLLRAGRWVHL